MNIFLWILQGLLALMFLPSGANKAFQSQKVKAAGDWAEDVSVNNIKIIGILEMLGAIGLILPMLLGIAPILTPLAAIGLALTMVVAALLQFKRKEVKVAVVCLVIAALALVIVFGRF